MLLVLISVLLIHNTLSVGIEAQKGENKGHAPYGSAREGFVKIPFMAEAVVMGAAGVVIPLILSDVAVPLGTCLCRFRSEWSGQPERTGVRLLTEAQVFPDLSVHPYFWDFSRGCGRIVCYGEVEAQEERALMCVVSYNGDLNIIKQDFRPLEGRKSCFIITFYLGLLILRCGGNYGDQFRLSVFCLPASSCRTSHSAKYGLMTLKGAGPISRRKRLNSMLV